MKKELCFAEIGREILQIRLNYPLLSKEEMKRVNPEKYAKMKQEMKALRKKYK